MDLEETETQASTSLSEPWPVYIVNSFNYALQPSLSHNPSALTGPYIRLLYYLFGLSGPFQISLRHPPSGGASTNASPLMCIVTVNEIYPVFFLHLHPFSASFTLESARHAADAHMRDTFRDLRHNVIYPRLPAICAFGTKLAFYEYTFESNALYPPAILEDPVILNDVAPVERWRCDLLQEAGVARVRQIVKDIKEMEQERISSN
ncbi:hypothetical protein D9611_012956 [Ephemerocybe angulata]|uniref:Uncharacterized protein n=1 Tax=Ephemerocybe angulata TaxID=980116 RepID=A0A8H5FFQ9_9AGAR|nr:hypothetical protein D9611_012956 [Tulosesus angulatus]